MKSIIVLLTISSLYSQVSGLSGWDIFIDPGHSQRENMGVNGYSEAEEALKVGLHLQDILLNQTDIDTAYISRKNNQEQVTLYQRTHHANSLGASWYHSIHSNAGASDHNNTLLLWGELYNGQPDPPSGGEEMSGYMIDLLTRGMRISTIGSRGDCSFYSYTGACSNSWQGPYLYVNRNTNMPSELSEEGHHTHPVQNQLTMNEEYKRLLAYTFYWSILEYHNIVRPFVGICAGIIRDLENAVPINGATVSLNEQTYTTDTYTSLFNHYTNDPNALHNGFFFFENLPDSTIPLVVAADGYYPDTMFVEINNSFITFRDIELLSSTPPTVILTNPVEGEQGYPAWDPVKITFSRAMNRDSTEQAIEFLPSVPLSYQWINDSKTVLIYPDSSLYETDFTITITERARDIYGHVFDGDIDGNPGGTFTLHYQSSASDIEAPILVNLYPPMTSSNIEQHPLVNLTFNEIIGHTDTLLHLIRLERFQTGEDIPILIEHYSVNEHSVVSLFPENPLFPNEVFITRIIPGIRDLFGNTVSGAYNISFQTGNTDWAINELDNFENNLMSNWWAPSMSGSTTGTVAEETGMGSDSSIINHITASQVAMAINYRWDVNASNWLIREYLGGGAPRNIIFNDEFTMQAYIFGDGNGTLFRFCVDDNVPQSGASNHEVSPWYTVDWYGWKLISWNMIEDGTGSWIGDGSLNGNLRFDSFQLSYVNGNISQGSIIIDDLRLVKEVKLNVVDQADIPDEFVLKQNYPNPFNPETIIEFSLPSTQNAEVKIFSLMGKHIRTLVQKRLTRGTYSLKWNGKDQNGISVPSGVYFYTLKTNTRQLTNRMVLLK